MLWLNCSHLKNFQNVILAHAFNLTVTVEPHKTPHVHWVMTGEFATLSFNFYSFPFRSCNLQLSAICLVGQAFQSSSHWTLVSSIEVLEQFLGHRCWFSSQVNSLILWDASVSLTLSVLPNLLRTIVLAGSQLLKVSHNWSYTCCFHGVARGNVYFSTHLHHSVDWSILPYAFLHTSTYWHL